MLSFELDVVEPGDTATVTVDLPGPVDAYYKLSSDRTSWTDFAWDGTTGAQFGPGNRLTLTLEDGGRGDADGIANGQIFDPGAPAIVALVGSAPDAVDDDVTTVEDTPLSIPVADLLANDSDADSQPLHVVSVSGTGASFDSVAGTVTYTPAADTCGPASFTYTVADPDGNTDVATVHVSVTCVNDAPVANDDTASTTEGTPVTVDVLDNDVDVDGDALDVAIVSESGGDAVVTASDELEFTPTACGTTGFVYSVDDGHNGTDTASVNVTVTCAPSNHDPVADDDSATTLEDTQVTVDVLAGDTDADGDPLVVSNTTNLVGGTVVDHGDGTVTFTPTADRCAPDGGSFRYTVSDPDGAADDGNVSIAITCVNDPPVAADDGVSASEDTTVDVPLATLLTNDTDVDGDGLLVTAVTGTGAVLDLVNGVVHFTPPSGACAPTPVSFGYTVSDGTDTDDSVVHVDVACVDHAPNAVDDPVTTPEDTPVVVDVLANDTDPEGGTLHFTVDPLSVQGGTVEIVTDPLDPNPSDPYERVRFTPTADACGPLFDAGFTYTASDPTAHTDAADVVVTVTCVDDPPVAQDDVATTTPSTPVTVAVLANDTDADSPSLSVSAVGATIGGTTAVVNGGNAVEFTPAAGVCGDVAFGYSASDGNSTDDASVTVTVQCDPLAVGAGGPYTLAEGATVSLAASAAGGSGPYTYAWDLDADGTFETAGASPVFSAVALDGPKTVTVGVRVEDAGARTATSSALVTVTNVAPTGFLQAPASVAVGQSFGLSIGNLADVPADVTALRVAFDCGTGAFGALQVATSTTCGAPSVGGTLTVRARLDDGDGGTTVLTASIAVTSTHALRWTTRTDRGASAALHGATLSGRVAIFVPGTNTDLRTVTFFVDGVQVRSDVSAPFDLVGSLANGDAKPYSTRKLPDGTHTVQARIVLANRSVEIQDATFTTSNPRPATCRPMVSTSSQRTNVVPLDGAQLSGQVAIFVPGEPDLKRVDFYLDDPQMTGTLDGKDGTEPYDYAGTRSNGTAKLATFPHGSHTLTARLTFTDGFVDVITVPFTA